MTEDAPCKFARPNAWLTIEIVTGHDLAPRLAKCASPTAALKAIGNEAFACAIGGKTEQAVGRVRDQIFIITISANDKPDVLREKVRLAAEQVAGNLY